MYQHEYLSMNAIERAMYDAQQYHKNLANESRMYRDDNSEWKQQQDEQQELNQKGKNIMANEKNKRALTPVGLAKWAHIQTPKKPFTDEKGRQQGESKYQIDVCFTPDDPSWKAWATALSTAIKAIPEQTDKRTGEVLKKQQPIKRELGADDQPTGRFYVTFKTGEKFKPAVFDKYGVVIPESVMIGNESKVRVSYLPAEYLAFGGGIALYLNAVQVLELVEYKAQTADAYGFETEALPNEIQADESSDPFANFDNDPLF